MNKICNCAHRQSLHIIYSNLKNLDSNLQIPTFKKVSQKKKTNETWMDNLTNLQLIEFCSKDKSKDEKTKVAASFQEQISHHTLC